jgi:hypothetical protein
LPAGYTRAHASQAAPAARRAGGRSGRRGRQVNDATAASRR